MIEREDIRGEGGAARQEPGQLVGRCMHNLVEDFLFVNIVDAHIHTYTQ